jgi:hypothetical protein
MPVCLRATRLCATWPRAGSGQGDQLATLKCLTPLYPPQTAEMYAPRFCCHSVALPPSALPLCHLVPSLAFDERQDRFATQRGGSKQFFSLRHPSSIT